MESTPHEALFLVLAYLPLHQLLSMSRVCKVFHDAVNSDVLVWLDLVVEKSLSSRLTDDILMRFASKSRGRLRTLALLNCFNITDDCLTRIINANPLITKLYLPSCTGLTPTPILEAAKTLTKLKQVKIDGIYNFNQDHLLELTHRLPKTTTRRVPKFYHKFRNLTFQTLDEDSSSVDVEQCPKCKGVKLVFDCTRDACTAMKGSVVGCRGCSDCVTRCEGCGVCISNNEADEELGETVCNDMLCVNCWLRFPKCSHCNKAYCPTHYEEIKLNFPICGGFVCQSCEVKQAN